MCSASFRCGGGLGWVLVAGGFVVLGERLVVGMCGCLGEGVFLGFCLGEELVLARCLVEG